MAIDQRKSLFIVLGVLVVVAGGIYLLTGSRRAPSIAKEFTEYCACLSCKAESSVTYPREEPAPHRCPKCGAQAAYPVFYCFNCKHRFVPTLVRYGGSSTPGLPTTVACPKCASTQVMPFTANDPLFAPVGETLLPRWP